MHKEGILIQSYQTPHNLYYILNGSKCENITCEVYFQHTLELTCVWSNHIIVTIVILLFKKVKS